MIVEFVVLLFRVIWVFSFLEIEDVEIGLLDDFKVGNGYNVVNGVVNGILFVFFISLVSFL